MLGYNNVANSNFFSAATGCAAVGGDVCSTAQLAVLRIAGVITVPAWSNSHSDNDGQNAATALGAMADNPNITTDAGFACCLN
jgi:hypothetical protein